MVDAEAEWHLPIPRELRRGDHDEELVAQRDLADRAAVVADGVDPQSSNFSSSGNDSTFTPSPPQPAATSATSATASTRAFMRTLYVAPLTRR